MTTKSTGKSWFGGTPHRSDPIPICTPRTGRRLLALTVVAAISVAGCGDSNGDSEQARTDTADAAGAEVVDPGEDAGGDAEIGAGASDAAGDVPDACSFFDVEEISAAIGREVGPGEPESTTEVGSSCRFKTLTGMSTSTTYDDPVIPETALASVTISTARSGAEEFDEFEALIGDGAEPVSGIGDDAYFWGRDILYVRVADRGLTVRIEADETDDAAVRAAILRLAELGASKL